MSQLNKQVVLVTGANRGIGRSIVVGALNRGAKRVYAAVRKLDSAKSLVSEFGDRVVPIVLDLEKPETVSAAAKLASDVTLVINNAGVFTGSGALAEDAIESTEYLVNVNVLGLIRVAQAFAPVLKANGGGALAQLNSVASVKTFAAGGAYSASKAASYAITQSLREELAGQGTQVISVHPGPIETDMYHQSKFELPAEPASVVADALFEALETKSFHVFPDSLAKQFWQGYQSYATTVIESDPLAVAH
jgi:NAD(P)-dependent dehydrogenase (short-subunit alcohol dehydrogenase family)